MPMPNFMRHVNKRVFNPRELARGRRPVVTHIGRVSGTEYRTPVEPREIEGGYAFILMYGAKSSDWVKNIQVTGTATLTIDGEVRELVDPVVMVDDEAWGLLPEGAERPPGFLKVTEILRMSLA